MSSGKCKLNQQRNTTLHVWEWLKIKNTDTTKCSWRCKTRWECKTVQPLWKTVLRFLTKLYMLLPYTLGFPGGSGGKASACNAGDPGSIPGLGRSPGEGNGNPLQHSCLDGVSLISYSSWGRKGSDVTERLHFHFHFAIYPTYHIPKELKYMSNTNSCMQMFIADFFIIAKT